jgi:lipoprotein-anchoring transpeptidase ErfK/SrfK
VRRTVLTWTLALLSAGLCSAVTTAGAAGHARVAVTQPLAMLLQNHVARTKPALAAHMIESVSATRPLTKVRTVLPVIGTDKSRSGDTWLHVRLPGRPSGLTGWILADQTVASSTEWAIVVTLGNRQVTVYRDGNPVRHFSAVVGKPSTPTPQGEFFVEEALSISAHDVGGPYALATSARSAVLQDFEGGPGQIAIHGTDGLPDPLGSAASHGCVRISPSAITWLSSRIGAGTPVTIRH